MREMSIIQSSLSFLQNMGIETKLKTIPAMTAGKDVVVGTKTSQFYLHTTNVG